MNKFISVAMLSLVLISFMGCDKTKDGSETAMTASNSAMAEKVAYHNEVGPDDRGWLTVVDFEKAGDDILSATFDSILLDKSSYYTAESPNYKIGDLKTDLSKAGFYNMKVAGAKADWHEQIAAVEAYFVKNDSFDGITFDEEGHDVDGVTTASIHISEFVDAVKGATPLDQSVVTYAVEAPMDDKGFQSFVIYQKKGDDVISATFDGFLADPSGYQDKGVELGALKSDMSKAGLYDMTVAGAKDHWHVQAANLAKYFVENDSFNKINFDEEGHDADGVTGATIHINGFTNLVK